LYTSYARLCDFQRPSSQRCNAGQHRDPEFVYGETLLAQPEIVSRTSAQAQRVLFAKIIKKGQQKQNAADVYGILSQKATTLTMGTALNQVNDSPPGVSRLHVNVPWLEPDQEAHYCC
jgi:hypothetical protein